MVLEEAVVAFVHLLLSQKQVLETSLLSVLLKGILAERAVVQQVIQTELVVAVAPEVLELREEPEVVVAVVLEPHLVLEEVG